MSKLIYAISNVINESLMKFGGRVGDWLSFELQEIQSDIVKSVKYITKYFDKITQHGSFTPKQ